jgi:hypothetical protein
MGECLHKLKPFKLLHVTCDRVCYNLFVYYGDVPECTRIYVGALVDILGSQAASLKVTAFWDIVPCKVGRRFIRVMMEAVNPSETSVIFHGTTRQYMAEGCRHLQLPWMFERAAVFYSGRSSSSLSRLACVVSVDLMSSVLIW